MHIEHDRSQDLLGMVSQARVVEIWQLGIYRPGEHFPCLQNSFHVVEDEV